MRDVSTIDPRSTVLAALQARLAPLRTARAAVRPPAGAPANADSSQAVASTVARRIAALDPSDPDRRRKAVRVVLEAELARAFGSALLNDPAFPEMLDTVQAQMQADPQSAAAVHALGNLLLAGTTLPGSPRAA